MLQLLASLTLGLHICGSYCGPTWCDNAAIAETSCNDSYAPETHASTGPSCADSCCKLHDICCGHGTRSTCNTAIVNCLGECNAMSLTCTLHGVPVPAGGIRVAMNIVSSWCCGSPCSWANASDATMEEAHAAMVLELGL
jgi:hypothetical protein|tara:strand:- start:14 stop:433 length:420 start_codon:yes stop_codon:yes gene_type:complete